MNQAKVAPIAAPKFKEDRPDVVLGTTGTLESLSYFPKIEPEPPLSVKP